jgi:hypothetical protein
MMNATFVPDAFVIKEGEKIIGKGLFLRSEIKLYFI